MGGGGGIQWLGRVVRLRAERLVDFQDASYAAQYLSSVNAIYAWEQQWQGVKGGGRAEAAEVEEDTVPLTSAVAWNYFKVLAYKDEIEVSRLHLSYGPSAEQLAREFESGFEIYYNLSPQGLAPIDSRTGVPQKLAIPAWLCRPLFLALAAMKPWRGSWFDPFRYSAERRRDLQTLQQFQSDLSLVLSLAQQGALTPGRLVLATELMRLPAMVRGYGHVKAASIVTANQRREAILRRLLDPDQGQNTPVAASIHGRPD